MIKDNIAASISKIPTKTFSSISDSSKPSIQRIFCNHWNDFLNDPEVINRGFRPVVLKEVEKMIACGTLDSGFEIYECPNCHKNHIICYTCKSRFCNPCGTKAAKQRAEYITHSTLEVSHRHIVFTIDERLRFFFQRDRSLLNALFSAAKDTLFYVFDKVNGKNKSFTPGFILTLHTFGRALNWNPHIHCLCTEGGMDDDHHYTPIKYIHYAVLRKSFLKQLSIHMKAFYHDQPILLKELSSIFNDIYKEKSNGFYVNAPKMKSKDKKGKSAVVNYIIRYTGRPVMASSRITNYDSSNNSISYYYEDHKTNQRVDVSEDIFSFIKKLIIHIPEPQFKMVRYYGIYATCDHIHKTETRKLLSHFQDTRSIHDRFSYRKDLITLFGTDPFLCDCGHFMEFVDYWVPNNRRNILDEDLC